MGRFTYGSAGLLALSLLTACTATTATRQAVKPAAAPAVSVAVIPGDRARDVPTEEPVVVAADAGRLTSVHVTSDQGRLTGVISADGTRWRSNQTARPGTKYTVRTVAVNADGRRKESTSTFTTVKAAQTFDIEYITPNSNDTGTTVGVGMPIMITFDKPITDRVAIERNLTVQSSKPVQGAWHWFDDRHVDFRPTEYWPAYTKVRLDARLAGVRGGEGMYGKRDVRLDFRIGREQITRGTTQNHVLTVRRDGKVIRTMPMSAGQGGAWKFYTTSGIHLAMSREAMTVMTSPGIGPGESGYYQLTVYDTVRISNSGEYVHSAPWSVGAQGNSNVSHGCVNVSPENAKWFVDNTLIGDPIIITGSPRVLEPTNGWGHWQENWKEWLKWSSIKDGPTVGF
ncbi:Ig-like domain-containing protein [Nonomuraea sp. NPDC050383]|uniref:L,D-transpeptidase n=1 Tax=Nonomuraea sp. NPDC050383 TaxID=3364362 RepID=UPI003791C1A3